VASVEASGIEFDTVVLAPSSRHDAVPFMTAIATRWPNARGITSSFNRQGVAKAANPGGPEVMGKELVHPPDGKEKEIRSLLIVDESVGEGKTAAIIGHLRTGAHAEGGEGNASGVLPDEIALLHLPYMYRTYR
jgi:hypothetical protein